MITIELSKKFKWKTCVNNNTHKLLDKIHKLDQILTIDVYDYFNFAYFQQNKMIYSKMKNMISKLSY